MKRTIIAVISIVLIAFAFTACRQSVVIPFDPMPGPNTPSEPSVPDYTIQVGDKTYQHLDEAIAAAPVNGTINIGAGRFVIPSTLSFKNLTINGAGMDETIIEVNGSWGFNVTGSSTTISNLTIADASGTASRLLNVQASQILIDHVRLEGKYNSNSSGATNSGILADSNVTDITVKNSEFKGIRMPLNIDLENAENPKVTISENVFDTFLKLAFTTNIDLLDISSDNTFNPVDAEYHIELFNKGDLTAERAIEVAATTGLVVQAELRDGKFYFDAEGAVISTVEQLKAFAAGTLGAKGKLINTEPINLSEYVTFSAENLLLDGEASVGISVSSDTGFVITGKGISIANVKFTGTGTAGAYFVAVGGENATIKDCSFIGTGDNGFGGIKTDALNTTIIGNNFNQVRIPFYFDENNKGVESFTGSATGNIVNDCLKIDLETASLVEKITGNTITDTPVNILANGSADTAIALAAANDCTVSYDGITYDAEGALISTEEQLSKFASGQAGIKARLTKPLSVTTPISFVANELSLSGTAENVVTVSSVDGFEINGNNILFDSISFEASGSGSVYFVSVSGTGVTVENCKFTGNVDSSSNNRVMYGVRTDGENTKIIGNTFINLRIPFYIDESNATDISSVDVIGNTINGCRKVDLETAEFVNSISDNTFTDALLEYDIEILEGGTAENAKTLSEANGKCTVKYDGGTYPEA